MGSNLYGQLGLGDVELTYKGSPHLIEELLDKQISKISSGVRIFTNKKRQITLWL